MLPMRPGVAPPGTPGMPMPPTPGLGPLGTQSMSMPPTPGLTPAVSAGVPFTPPAAPPPMGMHQFPAASTASMRGTTPPHGGTGTLARRAAAPTSPMPGGHHHDGVCSSIPSYVASSLTNSSMGRGQSMLTQPGLNGSSTVRVRREVTPPPSFRAHQSQVCPSNGTMVAQMGVKPLVRGPPSDAKAPLVRREPSPIEAPMLRRTPSPTEGRRVLPVGASPLIRLRSLSQGPPASNSCTTPHTSCVPPPSPLPGAKVLDASSGGANPTSVEDSAANAVAQPSSPKGQRQENAPPTPGVAGNLSGSGAPCRGARTSFGQDFYPQILQNFQKKVPQVQTPQQSHRNLSCSNLQQTQTPVLQRVASQPSTSAPQRQAATPVPPQRPSPMSPHRQLVNLSASCGPGSAVLPPGSPAVVATAAAAASAVDQAQRSLPTRRHSQGAEVISNASGSSVSASASGSACAVGGATASVTVSRNSATGSKSFQPMQSDGLLYETTGPAKYSSVLRFDSAGSTSSSRNELEILRAENASLRSDQVAREKMQVRLKSENAELWDQVRDHRRMIDDLSVQLRTMQETMREQKSGASQARDGGRHGSAPVCSSTALGSSPAQSLSEPCTPRSPASLFAPSNMVPHSEDDCTSDHLCGSIGSFRARESAGAPLDLPAASPTDSSRSGTTQSRRQDSTAQREPPPTEAGGSRVLLAEVANSLSKELLATLRPLPSTTSSHSTMAQVCQGTSQLSQTAPAFGGMNTGGSNEGRDVALEASQQLLNPGGLSSSTSCIGNTNRINEDELTTQIANLKAHMVAVEAQGDSLRAATRAVEQEYMRMVATNKFRSTSATSQLDVTLTEIAMPYPQDEDTIGADGK
eukprot:TRINITY_DN48611_c0_g1_i1.p1 TRINITY_DN48611_c0_g1~~TRINITY_DN48611_c0_g1_i1.p1  ORF type:complete len:862 (-),score=137.83 TRINITY_DN48611_c0_g1_i1:71-2656(-)